MSLGSKDIIMKAPMAVAWRAAAIDLGIRFESPFGIEYLGNVYWCSGWLPDFGGPAGTIIAGLDTVDEIFDVADAAGYYTSALNPIHYESYEREHFIETLNDWGWFGDPDRAPPWFRGRFKQHGGAA